MSRHMLFFSFDVLLHEKHCGDFVNALQQPHNYARESEFLAAETDRSKMPYVYECVEDYAWTKFSERNKLIKECACHEELGYTH